MQQIPPPQFPPHETDLPATPAVIPTLPTRVLQPGRHAPLPDALAIRPCHVPSSAPPFDDDPDPVADEDVVPVTCRPPAEELAAAESAAPSAGFRDPDESDKERQDPPAGWPSQFAQVLAETLAGSRPAQQLTPWTTEQARKRIKQLGPLLATDQRPLVRRVMTSAPAADVLEMTAVVGFGPRVRVLALRLELEQPRAYRRRGSRWCCTAIESV